MRESQSGGRLVQPAILIEPEMPATREIAGDVEDVAQNSPA
jgi:hypothetical protein